jgi:hypothetical protein
MWTTCSWATGDRWSCTFSAAAALLSLRDRPAQGGGAGAAGAGQQQPWRSGPRSSGHSVLGAPPPPPPWNLSGTNLLGAPIDLLELLLTAFPACPLPSQVPAQACTLH